MSQDSSFTLEDGTKALMFKKRNFTRIYDNAGKITAFATTNPTNDVAIEVKRVQDRLSKAYGEVMDLTDEVANLDQLTEGDRYEKYKEETQTHYQDMTERILATLSTVEKAARAPINVQN